MQKMFITKSSIETQKLGKMLSRELKNGGIIAIEGELGSGKTTFTQGFLKGLKIKGPYTSPTFLVIKNYKKKIPNPKSQYLNKSKITNPKIQNIYHVDTYRVNSKDILNLGWEEIAADKNNIIIVEWADRIKKIIPTGALWIKFKWINNNTREIKIYENKIKQ
jgi:tRNA threonylcarbamoyladenosine biosynthesis protein TsaE